LGKLEAICDSDAKFPLTPALSLGERGVSTAVDRP